MNRHAASENIDSAHWEAITKISVKGFKSIHEQQTIEVRPLTVLAGVNSSGKSSMMQPLLLMKQTEESSFDPGTFLLDGPNVKFSAVDEFFSSEEQRMAVELEFQKGRLEFPSMTSVLESFTMFLEYAKSSSNPVGVDVVSTSTKVGGINQQLFTGMSSEDISNQIRDSGDRIKPISAQFEFKLYPRRCFLRVECDYHEAEKSGKSQIKGFEDFNFRGIGITRELIMETLHVPGLRGNPERRYPRTASGPAFPGTFVPYVASVIDSWQTSNDPRIKQLEGILQDLGLASKIKSFPLKDAHVEIQVSRTMKGRSRGLVNIADVGLGVSQVLPVLVALLTAEQGQMVYIEEPEIHLHPRAQVAMAKVLADAAKRGVRVVAETHSPLLLLAIQTLVAQGYLSPDLVKLHWFTLDKVGYTKITSSDLDEAGRFDTDWPEDFGTVELDAQRKFLNESEKRLAGM
jgi:predicted ATPase